MTAGTEGGNRAWAVDLTRLLAKRGQVVGAVHDVLGGSNINIAGCCFSLEQEVWVVCPYIQGVVWDDGRSGGYDRDSEEGNECGLHLWSRYRCYD